MGASMNSPAPSLHKDLSQGERPQCFQSIVACDVTGSSWTDNEIAVQVEEHLAVLSDDIPFDIETRILNGEVFLRGMVCSPQDRRLILNVISQIPGIQGTHHRIAIFEDGKMCEDDASPPAWFEVLLIASGLLVILGGSVLVGRWF